MRELDFDHVTPFRPITRLNFWILKFLRCYPYKKIHNRVCHIWVGFVISGWDLSYVGGLSYMGIKSYSRRISSQYLSKREPIFDKPHPYMTHPPIYDKSHPDVTVQIGRCLSPGFVEYGPLFTEVLWWNTSRIIIIWDLSPGFVIYG